MDEKRERRRRNRLGCAFLILGLIAVAIGAIITGIAVSRIDKVEDTNVVIINSSVVISGVSGGFEDTCPIDGEDVACNDGNDCTQGHLCNDTTGVHGIGSFNLTYCYQRNLTDTNCTSPCAKDGVGTCSDGRCKVACAGRCDTIADCPDVPTQQYINETINDPMHIPLYFYDKFCAYNMCFYRLSWPPDTNFPCFVGTQAGEGEEPIENLGGHYPLDFDTVPDDFDKGVCMDFIDDNFPGKRCLRSFLICQLSYNLFLTPNQCFYQYKCSEFTQNLMPVIVDYIINSTQT